MNWPPQCITAIAAVALISANFSAISAQEKIARKDALAVKLNDPAPQFMLAYTKGDRVQFTVAKPALRSAFPKLYAIDLPGADMNSFGAHLSIISAQYASGEKIERKDLGRLLETQRVVIVSMNNRPVDPVFMELLKEDTLVLRVDHVSMLVYAITPRDYSRLEKASVDK